MIGINQIILKFNENETRLVGNGVGKCIYESQIKNKVDYSVVNILKIPKEIEDVSISFVKGLTEDIFNNISLDEFEKYFIIDSNKKVKNKMINSIFY